MKRAAEKQPEARKAQETQHKQKASKGKDEEPRTQEKQQRTDEERKTKEVIAARKVKDEGPISSTITFSSDFKYTSIPTNAASPESPRNSCPFSTATNFTDNADGSDNTFSDVSSVSSANLLSGRITLAVLPIVGTATAEWAEDQQKARERQRAAQAGKSGKEQQKANEMVR